MPSLVHQTVSLFLLAIPIACVAWTVTHEEIFREPRDYCVRQSQGAASWSRRKFFYVFTCEYCFSHYVTALFLWFTRYTLLYPDWRGYVIAGFALVFVSNLYMGVFGQVKLGVKKDRAEIKQIETEVRQQELSPVKPPQSRKPAA